MFRIEKHLETANRYRATALASFESLSNMSDLYETTNAGRAEAKIRKEKLFDALVRLIYTPIDTGYERDKKLEISQFTELVSAAASRSEK
jgi:hypothetical protein